MPLPFGPKKKKSSIGGSIQRRTEGAEEKNKRRKRGEELEKPHYGLKPSEVGEENTDKTKNRRKKIIKKPLSRVRNNGRRRRARKRF